jgi:CheY-like chemotaxis protein
VTQLNCQVAPERRPPRILVVEDEPLIRFSVAESLRDLNVSVVEASTADEAWAFLTDGGSVDLVFTDFRMPGKLSGGELASLIRRNYPHLIVVVTSAYLNDFDTSERIIAKPYDLFETANALAERALSRQRKEGGS